MLAVLVLILAILDPRVALLLAILACLIYQTRI